jgi:tRNA(adenine34) deaminase
MVEHRIDAKADELWMEEALRLALRSAAAGEVPVGAVLVRDQEVLGRGWNQVIAAHDASAHAEIMALREAGERVGNYRLCGADLYVTLEPCAMCAGALVQARIRRLIIGALDPKSGAAGSVLQVVNHPALNHRVQVTSGVLARRCTELLQTFFRERRAHPATGSVDDPDQ